MKRNRTNKRRPKRHGGLKVRLEGLEERMMLNGGGIPGLEDQLIAIEAEFQLAPDVVYIGHHEEADGFSHGWTDVDGDGAVADFAGEAGYVKMAFDRVSGQLLDIEVHDTDFECDSDDAFPGLGSRFMIGMWKNSPGDMKVQIESLTADADVELDYLGIAGLEFVGSGVDFDGSIGTLSLGAVGEGVDVEVARADEIWISQGFAGDLEVGGDVSQIKAYAYGGVSGTIHVEGDLESMTVGDGDLTGSLHVGGNLGELTVQDGDIDGSVRVDGRAGTILATVDQPAMGPGPSDGDEPGGHIAGTLHLRKGAGLVHADGGSIDLDVFTSRGDVHLRADGRVLDNGTYSPGSVSIGGNAFVRGHAVIEAHGGNVELSRLTVWGGSAVIRATSSSHSADTGNVSAQRLNLIASRAWHVIAAQGGDVDVRRLNVRSALFVTPSGYARKTYVTIAAREGYADGAFQGGEVRLGRSRIQAHTAISAYGGNIVLGGRVDVYGNMTRLVATKSSNSIGPSGRLVAKGASQGSANLRIHGTLRYMDVDRLGAKIDADAMKLARIRSQGVADKALPGQSTGWLRSRSRTGFVIGANSWIAMAHTVDGLIHALSS